MSRRGFALAGALVALTALAALVTTALLTAWVEQRAARGGADALRALDAAEAGLAVVAADWNGLAPALAVGERVQGPFTALDRWTGFTPTVRRLTEHLYLVRSEGVRVDARADVLARSAVVLLGRSDGPTLVPLPQRSWLQLY